MRNGTLVTEFILVGIVGGPGLRITIFIFLLTVYLISLLGNSLMIAIICLDRRLQTPMYFFLCNLSLIETLNISTLVPFLLLQICSFHTSISKANCFAQAFFFSFFVDTVFFLVLIMSYDRYVAICNPLRYTSIMNTKLCIFLVIGALMVSQLVLLGPTVVITRLPFCGANIINHVFCESSTITKLACADAGLVDFVIGMAFSFLYLSSFILTFASYICIICTVLRIPSTDGRQKAFSTCTSHLTMVAIIYGSAFFIEVSPALKPSVEVYKAVQISGSLISPLMNPFVYTFRNEKVKVVLKELLQRGCGISAVN